MTPIGLWLVTAVVLGGFAIAEAQELPSEVVLLARLKSHIALELAQTPNFTCLENIARFHKEPRSSRAELSPLDRLQIEIVYADHHEWFGWPGARSLTVDDPTAFIGGGMIGNGAFALTLNNIVAAATFTYRGQEIIGGRSAVRYDYRLPRAVDRRKITVSAGSGTVGEEGSLWADPKSLQLLRLTARAVEIPPYLPVAEATTDIQYAPVQVGGQAVVLAQQADLYLRESDGTEDFDRLAFTHCRAFSTNSAIHFDPEPRDGPTTQPEAPTAAPVSNSQFVPALLMVTVELITTISDKDQVGTPIEGRVRGNVLRKGRILIHDGAEVHGRIRRLEHYGDGGVYVVGLEFTDVVTAAGAALFYADILRLDKNPRIKPALADRVLVTDATGVNVRETAVTLPELPGVASFFVTGGNFMLPGGFRTVWRTRGPIR